MKTKMIPALLAVLAAGAFSGSADAAAETLNDRNFSYSLDLKTPGNPATRHELTAMRTAGGGQTLTAAESLPVAIFRSVTTTPEGESVRVAITALEDVNFSYGESYATGLAHSDNMFYMPGFWYRQNLRSPETAPSFHTSDSWIVREDRLSAPLTAVFSPSECRSYSVIRKDRFASDALAAHSEGEVIVSGRTSIGYTGFVNQDGKTVLRYGFPYREEPKTYIRKLTLAPPVQAFQHLAAGESVILEWEITGRDAQDFTDCVGKTWRYCYDTYRPQQVEGTYSVDFMKKTMSRYFLDSYVASTPVNYYASAEMKVATCASPQRAEIGFVGRTLLNAFNALEYGEATGEEKLAAEARSVFDSYLTNGISPAGFFEEVIYCPSGKTKETHSIRRQSEGIYAVLYYLDYEKSQGRRHTEWESKIRNMLDLFLTVQNPDGSFPRKFKDDLSLVDASTGSTPSATLPLVMGYKYFKDKRYLESAKRTVDYLEKDLISKADYFSSTLDANCEDKEASLYAATAAYYLALATGGEERDRYAGLALKASCFAISWYYVWDVPFARGQMLGDLGFKSRGWGNVSVENNHIDVFVFDFADVLRWLSEKYGEKRFGEFADVISTSMRQLLPFEGHLCGVAKAGYYPEVVQHTNWDYGRNGKGFYNGIFAPGWTVASLWELLTPGRAEHFLERKK